MKYTVRSKDVNQRLDKFIKKMAKDKSRSHIQKMIKEGLILIDNKTVLPHHFLKEGQVIAFDDINKSLKTPKNKRASDNSKIIKPKIIKETDDYLVLEKPVGLLVHPTDKGEKNTLVDWLKKKYPYILNVGEERYRAGIIHRLDRDVSGIMLACKTQEMYEHLKEQFKKRLIFKEYTALVHGSIEQEEGEIDFPIGRSREGFKMAAHPKDHGHKLDATDKTAITKYDVIERIKNYTLIKIAIKTGRTHQIRVHLNAFGHPVVGDSIYRIKKFWEVWKKNQKLDRIFLHATKIGFEDLKNQWQLFESDLPEKLKLYLKEIL